MTKLEIRKYLAEDVVEIASIYYNTIHNINIRDYSKEQVDAWAPSSSVDDYKGWQEKLTKIKPFVATIDNKIVGFAEFEEDGHIDCFYVHHEYQGQGIGSALISAIEQEAIKKDIKRIYAEVSITAKPFFEKQGFKIVKEQTVTCRDVDMNNFVMEKKENFIVSIDKNAGWNGFRVVKAATPLEWDSVKYFRNTYFFDPHGIDDPYTWTFTHEEHAHLVLYQGTDIIGYTHIQFWPNHITAIRIIAIDEDKRNQNTGSRFLDLIEKWLKSMDIKIIHAESRQSSLRFYLKNGYTKMPFDDPENHESDPNDVPVGKVL